VKKLPLVPILGKEGIGEVKKKIGELIYALLKKE
jgi:hypothetical protein